MRKITALIMALVVFALTACGSGGGSVLTVGDSKASLGEATFVLRELEAVYVEQYGEEIWNQGVEGNTFAQVVKEGAIESLTRLYVSKNIADENGVVLTQDESEEVELLIAQYLTVNPMTGLEEDGITEEDVRNIFMLNALGEKLMNEEMVDFVVDQARLSADLASDLSYQQIEAYGSEGVLEQVTVQHVLISTVTDEGEAVSAEEVEAAKAAAEDVFEKALAGEDFDQLVSEYSQDPELAQDGGIDTFYRGEMVPEFEEVAFSMEIGDMEIAVSDFGYHIILKLEHIYPDEDQVENVENYKSYLIEQYTLSQKQDAYDTFYEAWKDDYEVKLDENLWDTVKTSNEL